MSEVTECIGCEYWQPINNSGGAKVCHYCIITGNVRGIPEADIFTVYNKLKEALNLYNK